MKEKLLELGKFLHLVDDDNRLDLSDIAFVVIMVKIAIAPVLDFPSVVTLATVLLNKMHKRQKLASVDSIQQVKDQVAQVQDILNKVSPIVDKVKEVIK